MKKPCEQFGPERAQEIHELIAAATGRSHEDICDRCLFAAAAARVDPPDLRIVS